MIKDKEYPATHSMSTAWYCVDEDGNVGIFDIDDNGPIPDGGYEQNCVEDVFWEDFSYDGVQYKNLHLNPEQIPQMLEPMDIEDIWEREKDLEDWMNISWMEVIVQIDMTKFEIFKKAFDMEGEENHIRPLVCLSVDQGLFFVDFSFNKKGVELLEQNNVIIAKYKAPHYDYTDEEDLELRKKIHQENQKFPLYIYRQNYWPFHDPAIRETTPANPIKLEQLPDNIRNKVQRLPVKFKDRDKIQLAEYVPVSAVNSVEYVYEGKIWNELAKDETEKIYYHVDSHSTMDENTMRGLIDKGIAEEYDWHKHRHLKENND